MRLIGLWILDLNVEWRTRNVIFSPLDEDDVVAVVGEGVGHLVLLVALVPVKQLWKLKNEKILERWIKETLFYKKIINLAISISML